MTDKIVIEGNLMRHIRTSVISEAPLDSISEHLITRLPTIFPVLPSAGPTRYIGFDPNTQRGMMIVEIPPRTRSINVAHSGDRYREDAAANKTGWRVTFPFTYFVFPFHTMELTGGRIREFTIGNTGLFWRKETFRNADADFFHIAAVPNVDTGGGICWGSTITPQGSLSEHIDAMINTFFTSTFNQDLGHRTPFGTSLTQWEKDSEQPLNYLNWELWNEETNVNIEQLWAIFAQDQVPPVNMAELNPAYVDIPELPQNFTVLRAREWLQSLTPQHRARLAVALQPLDVAEEVTT